MASTSLHHFLDTVADAGLALIRRRPASRTVSPEDMAGLCRDLLSSRGEALGVTLARLIVDAYSTMNESHRYAFFRELHSRFHVDHGRILACADNYRKTGDDESLAALQSAVESPRQELFRRINMAPDGTRMLIAMREDILKSIASAPELTPVDDDLAHLLSSWFNRGFLVLRRIDWDTPASILEKIISYESVHTMAGWDDLRGRLAEDRRCFAFFHAALPDNPLIFVEVALVDGLSGSIQPLIGHQRPTIRASRANTAIFYSINNCQHGLKGISFGNFLIKQVVLELQREFPNLKTFATLSPIPQFRRWLSNVLAEPEPGLIAGSERSLLMALDTSDWNHCENELKSILLRLAAFYLLEIRRGQFPHDPVARFHLRNGARLARINWRGDVSAKGFSQSAGMMVNYVYDPRDIERNHEDYVANGTVAVTPAVRRLARN